MLHVLGFEPEIKVEEAPINLSLFSPLEQSVLKLLDEPMERDQLIQALAIGTSEANILLMKLEIASA